MNTDLYKITSELLQKKYEGDYWDFKMTHHKNKADLLHDILCMANSLHDKDCYIILGVRDRTGEIVGVDENSPRRNQQNIIDFLKTKKFAGDHRPVLELHTLKIGGRQIDVITIANTLSTPFYISEDFSDSSGGKIKTVHANNIYTRVGDTNTPIDKSADYSQVEYLWKKRLGLHLSPSTKLCWLLKDKHQWERGEDMHYNKIYPEFTLHFEGGESEYPEFYSYMMMNESTSYGMVRTYYSGTALCSYQTVWLDGGRYLTTTPTWGVIHLDKYCQDNISYKYFIEGTISYLLHKYMLDEESGEACSAQQRFYEVVLIFSSESEKNCFIEYIEASKSLLISNLESNILKYGNQVHGEIEPARSVLVKEIAIGVTLKKMLIDFRNAELE